MSRESISLRQVLNIFINEVMRKRNELLLRDEQHKIVDFILDNSSLKLTTNYVELTAENYLGVDEYNRDKPLRLPRFLSFDFIILDEDNLKRSWYLRSYSSFEELENLLYDSNNVDRLVMIDNEIVNYKVERNNFKNILRWSQDVYRLFYIKDDLDCEILYNNKFDLEIHMCVAARNKYKDLSIYNLISEQYLHYSIIETTNSQRSKAGTCKVSWALDNAQHWGNIDDYDGDDYEPF